MFDIGWFEIIIIVIITLVIINPKDIPKMLFFIGKYFNKIKLIIYNYQIQIKEIINIIEVDKSNIKNDFKEKINKSKYIQNKSSVIKNSKDILKKKHN